jgi:membrane associated rhomboid family serine protease
MATCYRHPNRETGVSCSNCGRPICPDCMTPTPVGMRCPECAAQKTKVKTIQNVGSDPRVTYVLIAINVIAFLASGQFGFQAEGGNKVYLNGVLYGPWVEDGDYWRLITGGFLHAGFLHIAFNMYLLYILGNLLEPAIGSVRFAILYFASLLAGSAGALIVSPLSPTVGASGAVFGLMGAAFIEMRARGQDPFGGGGVLSGIGGLILINLVLSFALRGISIGGHIGGLIGGGLVALIFIAAERMRQPALAYVGGIAFGVAAAAVGILAAAQSV